jgi:ABC-type molybdenum transport system ATPase subunit/photorepair protein PhrA
VLLLEDLQIKYYIMGFKEFEKKKAEEDKKKFTEIEKFLEKNRNADPSTFLGAQRAEKKAWSDKYYQKQVALAGKFTFPESVKLSNTEKNEDGSAIAAEDISLINLKQLTFSYDATVEAEKINWIFKDPIDFKVTATTRMGVMGPNGAGKSTLLKLLTEKLKPVTGSVTHHPKYTLAYFGQHSTSELELELTAYEFMSKQFPEEGAGTIRQHLAKTSIVGTVQDTRMERLSFSQRSCIIFSKLTFICPHLLILDEPTNFLDLESVDSLIAACNKYAGALLLVSHNRDFLKKCAKGFLSIVPGRFEMYDTLKTAERATYTFIAEMEEGGKIGANALVNNPGGGSVHPSLQKKVEVQNVEMVDGMRVMTIGGDSAPVKKAPILAPKGAVVWKDGDKCSALWTDGKWYAGVIKKVLPAGKGYSVTYTAYGNTANVPATSVKQEEVKVAAKPGAKAGAPAAKAGAKK